MKFIIIIFLEQQLYIQIYYHFYHNHHTVCPKSSDSFYVVNYYIKWVTTSWTYSVFQANI